MQPEVNRVRGDTRQTVQDVTVVEATQEDSLYLGPRLRQADHDQVVLLGQDPLEIFEQSRVVSDVALTVVTDEPIAMFGCRRIQVDPDMTYGLVWLMGSESFSRQGRWIVRNARPWVNAITQGCHTSGNVVDCDNDVHIRWLRWLNYSFIRKVSVMDHWFWEFARVHV